jgi:PRC-barrel domain protein
MARRPATAASGTREAVMTTPQDPQRYIHRAAVDPEGSRIGKISQVYLDDKTGQPLWVLVETGLFGTRNSFAPAHGSRFDGELLVLAVSKEQVKGAPNIDRGEQLSESEQDGLRQYYSDYLDTAAETSGYRESQQATKWDSGQEPAFRRTET